MATALSSAERGVHIWVITWPLLLPGRLGGGGSAAVAGKQTVRDEGSARWRATPRPLVSLPQGQVSGAWPESLSPERLQAWGAGGSSL